MQASTLAQRTAALFISQRTFSDGGSLTTGRNEIFRRCVYKCGVRSLGVVMFRVVFFAALSILPGALVRADTRATEAKNLARFEQFAGAPIESFDMWELYQW